MRPLAAVLAAMLAAGTLGAGCGPRAPAPAPAVRATADQAFDVTWGAAETVLRRYRFTIDRADKRAGIMTTLPLLGRHWFEFWRKDAVTTRDKLEGTLHGVYRQATVTLRRRDPGKDADAPGGKYVVEVAVRTSRSNLPTPQVTSTADAYDMFFRPQRVRRSYVFDEPHQTSIAQRVDLGRDEKLEQVLLQEIHLLARGSAGT